MAFANLRLVRRQLREIDLRAQVAAAAGTGQAGQDRRRSATTRIACEQTVPAIENDTLHLSLQDAVVHTPRQQSRICPVLLLLKHVINI